MKNLIFLSEKSWHVPLFNSLQEQLSDYTWILINNRIDFNLENIRKYSPEKIFIPHWSYIIPEEIFSEYPCVVFHMTDLPYGRGGSPLQNLIVRGKSETKISALLVDKGIDTGDIFLKETLILNGTAQEIFLRSIDVIRNMIVKIISQNIQPIPQDGEPENFKRRKPEDGNIASLDDLNKIYDYIRMLDADGYPRAFIETDHFRFEFSRASIKSNNEILADVRIIKK